MKTNGVYHAIRTDKIIRITNCKYYEDLFNPAFSIVTWQSGKKVFKKTLIYSDQFKFFKRIGSL